MIITYDKSYRKSTEGNGWTMFSDVKMKDSLIVHALESLVHKNAELTFDELYDKLKERYKNKTEKSYCDIYKDENQIDVTVRGVFPRFYILKGNVTLIGSY